MPSNIGVLEVVRYFSPATLGLNPAVGLSLGLAKRMRKVFWIFVGWLFLTPESQSTRRGLDGSEKQPPIKTDLPIDQQGSTTIDFLSHTLSLHSDLNEEKRHNLRPARLGGSRGRKQYGGGRCTWKSSGLSSKPAQSNLGALSPPAETGYRERSRARSKGRYFQSPFRHFGRSSAGASTARTELEFIQPIYPISRGRQIKSAAENGVGVEEADLREAQNQAEFEVKKLSRRAIGPRPPRASSAPAEMQKSSAVR